MCEAYTEETGVKVKQFSIGSGQDHMETLRAEMASKNPPTIFLHSGESRNCRSRKAAEHWI